VLASAGIGGLRYKSWHLTKWDLVAFAETIFGKPFVRAFPPKQISSFVPHFSAAARA
jgi:hypothetical protein